MLSFYTTSIAQSCYSTLFSACACYIFSPYLVRIQCLPIPAPRTTRPVSVFPTGCVPGLVVVRKHVGDHATIQSDHVALNHGLFPVAIYIAINLTLIYYWRRAYASHILLNLLRSFFFIDPPKCSLPYLLSLSYCIHKHEALHNPDGGNIRFFYYCNTSPNSKWPA